MYRNDTITAAVFNVECCMLQYLLLRCTVACISGEGKEIPLVESDRLTRAIV